MVACTLGDGVHQVVELLLTCGATADGDREVRVVLYSLYLLHVHYVVKCLQYFRSHMSYQILSTDIPVYVLEVKETSLIPGLPSFFGGYRQRRLGSLGTRLESEISLSQRVLSVCGNAASMWA